VKCIKISLKVILLFLLFICGKVFASESKIEVVERENNQFSILYYLEEGTLASLQTIEYDRSYFELSSFDSSMDATFTFGKENEAKWKKHTFLIDSDTSLSENNYVVLNFHFTDAFKKAQKGEIWFADLDAIDSAHHRMQSTGKKLTISIDQNNHLNGREVTSLSSFDETLVSLLATKSIGTMGIGALVVVSEI